MLEKSEKRREMEGGDFQLVGAFLIRLFKMVYLTSERHTGLQFFFSLQYPLQDTAIKYFH